MNGAQDTLLGVSGTIAARGGALPRTSAVAGLGTWSSFAAFAAASGYGVAQILQLVGVLVFPVDEIAIYGFSLLIATPFVLAMATLFEAVPTDKRIWALCALILGVMYATYVTIVYVTQLAVVIPARLAGDEASVEWLLVSPHKFSWVLDGAGYITMGFATLFAAAAVSGDPSANWLRRFLIANGLLNPLIIAIYISPGLLLLGSLWLVTAPGSLLLLALYFKRKSA